jgi:hypothetical protein
LDRGPGDLAKVACRESIKIAISHPPQFVSDKLSFVSRIQSGLHYYSVLENNFAERNELKFEVWTRA